LAAEIVEELQAVQSELAGTGPLPGLGRMVLRQLRRPRFAIPALAVLVALAASAAWLWVHNSRIQWARNVAVPEIARLMDEENVDAAFRLAQQAELYIPDDRQLLDLQRHYVTKVSINSTPPGADVYIKGYLNVDADWLHVGKTPLEGVSLPPGYLRWRVTKDGFAPAEAARYSIIPFNSSHYTRRRTHRPACCRYPEAPIDSAGCRPSSWKTTGSTSTRSPTNSSTSLSTRADTRNGSTGTIRL
jgi:hypothetical protein